MASRIVAALLLTSLSLPANSSCYFSRILSSSSPQATTECLDRLIPLLMKDGNVPGLSIAIISNGHIVWTHGFGVRSSESQAPVTDDTVFEAASLGKPVFSYAVLKLAATGRINLDTPLTEYLPESFDETEKQMEKITARVVLTHTTGFPNWRTGSKLKIYFTPGERFSYSGEGYVYLQKAVEHITGQDLDTFMHDTVFQPLGMSSSSYVWQDKYETWKVFSHDTSGVVSGRWKPIRANAAASLNTTAIDYAKFVTAILNRTGLSDSAIREMLRPRIKVSEKCYECLDPSPGRLSSTISWGLGWGLQSDTTGDSFWHWGDNGNAMAYVVAFDKQKCGVVLLANSANGLSVADEIVYQTLGVRQPQLTWLNFESYNSVPRKFYLDILSLGEAAIAHYREHRNAPGRHGVIPEDRMEGVASQLLDKKQTAQAIEVLEINVEDFPDSSDAYDSLGEVYVLTDNKKRAMVCFQRATELNPNNAHAVASLKLLTKSEP